MPNESLKENLDQLKVVPNNRFWRELEHRKFVCCTVQPGLEI